VCGRGALVVSVGRNQECIPACCIPRGVSYNELCMYRGMLGTYMYGTLQWSPGAVQGVRCFLLCNLLSSWSALDKYYTASPSGELRLGGALVCVMWWLYVCVPFVFILCT
jgi:hypothetical protein